MTTTLTLYELAEETLALDALLGLDEGECTPESDALAEELSAALVLKADAFGAYVASLTATEAAIAEEVTRLAARRRAVAAKAERLKRYALFALQRMDRTKVEGALFTLGVQNNPASVEIDCATEALPADYVRVVPASMAPDKTALAKALKAGTVIDGVRLVETQSLRVR